MRKGSKPDPQRTCVACRRVAPKRGLIRVVRNSDGNVSVDRSGRQNGRGAYLCRDLVCWARALKGRQLERSLRISINEENRKVLERTGKNLLSGELNNE